MEKYPYVLGYHIKTGKLCRLFDDGTIPQGFVKIICYKWLYKKTIAPYFYNPYDMHGELRQKYWNLPLAQDLDPNLRLSSVRENATS